MKFAACLLFVSMSGLCGADARQSAAPDWPWVTLREQDTGSLPICATGPTGTHANGWAVPVQRDGGDTLLVTALHVVADEGNALRPVKVQIPSPDWKSPAWLAATVERYDAEADLALLRIKAPCRVRELIAIEPIKHVAQRFQELHVPGAMVGDSGSGVLTDDGKLYGVIVRLRAFQGVPVEGAATVASAAMVRELLTAKVANK